ncbi:MAG: UDP-N-acetyl glucosamine 2-epimerase, partial [Elusimicrobiota bacterium]|nr:UDP-N-acetyl glucosamine 2-epimerase [Elusimicrobiota bacterium]
PDYFLDSVGKTLAATIGNIITKADEVMEKEKPDCILLYGDTNSCLSVMPAKRRKIPVFHMEAGNRSFDQRVPEELNRKVVDHLSDINMTLTEHARRYLISEGIRPETVIKTGSPMKEVLAYYMPKILKSDVLKRLKLKENAYFVVSAHREENIDSPENFRNLLGSLNALAKKYSMPVIVSTHPRTRKKLEELGMKGLDKRISFLKPLGFYDYVKLQLSAFCVVSDSGTITEESTILNVPAVTIRQAHERPEGMDEGTLIMCGLQAERVLESVAVVVKQHSAAKRRFRLVPDYDVDNVSKKVLRIILSYTDYVNRTVWRRSA